MMKNNKVRETCKPCSRSNRTARKSNSFVVMYRVTKWRMRSGLKMHKYKNMYFSPNNQIWMNGVRLVIFTLCFELVKITPSVGDNSFYLILFYRSPDYSLPIQYFYILIFIYIIIRLADCLNAWPDDDNLQRDGFISAPG